MENVRHFPASVDRRKSFDKTDFGISINFLR